MLYVSHPHKFPVLPKPQITSSATSGMSYFLKLVELNQNIIEGGITPPAP